MPMILAGPSSSLGLGSGSGATGGGTASGGGASSEIAALLGDVFVGGGLGYTERIKRDGTHLQLIHETDDLGNNGEVWGQTISGITGHRYSTLGVLGTDGTGNTPHDIAWCPDDSGHFVAIVPTAGSLKLYKYNLDATAVIGGPWTLAVETGWTSKPVKIDVACDSDTVYYTMQGKKIKRFKVSTTTQLADLQTLADSSPYIYGDLRVLNNKQVLVAMTDTGVGPRRGIALANDPDLGVVVWIDEVNTTTFHVYKRKSIDGTSVLSVLTKLDPANKNAAAFSLAAYYVRCPVSVGYADAFILT